jgi:hypothetical protein
MSVLSSPIARKTASICSNPTSGAAAMAAGGTRSSSIGVCTRRSRARSSSSTRYLAIWKSQVVKRHCMLKPGSPWCTFMKISWQRSSASAASPPTSRST